MLYIFNPLSIFLDKNNEVKQERPNPLENELGKDAPKSKIHDTKTYRPYRNGNKYLCDNIRYGAR